MLLSKTLLKRRVPRAWFKSVLNQSCVGSSGPPAHPHLGLSAFRPWAEESHRTHTFTQTTLAGLAVGWDIWSSKWIRYCDRCWSNTADDSSPWFLVWFWVYSLLEVDSLCGNVRLFRMSLLRPAEIQQQSGFISDSQQQHRFLLSRLLYLQRSAAAMLGRPHAEADHAPVGNQSPADCAVFAAPPLLWCSSAMIVAHRSLTCPRHN